MADYVFWNLYHYPKAFYRQFEQSKKKFGAPQINPDGSIRKREISKPIDLLKDRQRKIHNELKSLSLPDCMYGGVDKKNNVDNALQHLYNNFFLTIDLKNFFSNITNSRIHQMLIAKGLTWESARIITRITTFNGCLPQGAPTSTTLANLAFAPTAALLQQFCGVRGIQFTVFVDDLTFSSSRCFKHHVKEILEILKNNAFYVNPQKIHYKRNCCEITGIIVKNGKLRLPNEILRNSNNPQIKAYIDSVLRRYRLFTEIKV